MFPDPHKSQTCCEMCGAAKIGGDVEHQKFLFSEQAIVAQLAALCTQHPTSMRAVMLYIDGHRAKEIATVLEISKPRVTQLLRDADEYIPGWRLKYAH